jgi:hypothetical protein
VRDAREIAQDGPTVRVLEIERDGFLAAVERLEVERVVITGVRADVPCDIAADRGILDLDDLRAEIREQLSAERAGAELRHGDDAKALKHQARCPKDAWFFFGTSAVRLNVMTRSPR